jgi:enoyl-CoA hydratase/carnithine racemase
MDEPEWQQLYVNAEHDGKVGMITLSRESYNSDVDAELNRAIDWLKSEGIECVMVGGDFHLSTQLVGADTSEFFPALEVVEKGMEIAESWSRTARRLHHEFKISVGLINGKRCLGGMLELLMHCHYLVATEGAQLGMPEVTLPVVPGMEGCHWPFRKTEAKNWPRLVQLLLTGKSVSSKEAAGWLIDYAGPTDDALQMVWKIVTGGNHGLPPRKFEEGTLKGLPKDVEIPETGDVSLEAARKAIWENIQQSCGTNVAQALTLQAKHSAGFMSTGYCRKGRVGAEFKRTMAV